MSMVDRNCEPHERLIAYTRVLTTDPTTPTGKRNYKRGQPLMPTHDILAIEAEAATAERERLTPWIEHQVGCDGPVYPCTCGLKDAYPEVGGYSLIAAIEGEPGDD
jgi:hypothetical protein